MCSRGWLLTAGFTVSESLCEYAVKDQDFWLTVHFFFLQGEEKEDGDEEEDEDDGFFVPHGYLSEDEQGGSDAEHGDLDPSAQALLRKVGHGPVIAGPEFLAKFRIVPLVSYCPVDPLAFAFPSAAPLKRVV